MATYSWKSAVSGSWNTAGEWNPAGGPQFVLPGEGADSADTAPFETGSKKTYDVSGKGVALEIDVSGDHVIFNNFAFSNPTVGAALVIENHAHATIAASSNFLLSEVDEIVSGPLTVDDATLTVDGHLFGDYGDVSDHGHVIVSGVQSNFIVESAIGGLTVDATSTLSTPRRALRGSGTSQHDRCHCRLLGSARGRAQRTF